MKTRADGNGVLSQRFELTGANIRNAVFRAAARASMRPENERRVTMADLLKAADEETHCDTREKKLGFTTV